MTVCYHLQFIFMILAYVLFIAMLHTIVIAALDSRMYKREGEWVDKRRVKLYNSILKWLLILCLCFIVLSIFLPDKNEVLFYYEELIDKGVINLNTFDM